MRLPSKSYMDRTLKEAYTQHGNEIHFLKHDNTRPSNLYKERVGKSYGEPISVLGYLEMDPTELRLQDLGWSKETAEILFRAPFITLLEKGLASADGTLIISTDYKIVIPHLNKEYQVSKFHSREPFINGVPTFVWISGKKFINGR